MKSARREHAGIPPFLFFLFAASCCACSGKTILEGDAWNDNFECEERSIPLHPVVPEVLIVLDRSNSMGYDEFWIPTRDAVIGIAERYEEELMLGLTVFPDVEAVDGVSDCLASESPAVKVDFGTADDILSSLTSMGTVGGTPIAETLGSMHRYFNGRPLDNPQYILLATDGAPNCNSSLNGDTCRCTCTRPYEECAACTDLNTNCLDDERTYAVLDDLLADGIRTYVIGLSSAAVEWGDIMQAMAEHGGTETFYAAEDAEDVREMFETITSMVSECEFSFEPSSVQDSMLVNLYFDGHVVPQDPESLTGWSWTGENRIEFHGVSCSKIVTGEVSIVSATYGCPTVILER
jgi:hypothetical protein